MMFAILMQPTIEEPEVASASNDRPTFEDASWVTKIYGILRVEQSASLLSLG
jgi:hypothetical protein